MPVSVRFMRGKEANQFHPWVTHRLNRLLLGSLWTHPFGNVTFWRNFHEDCMCWMLLSSVLCDSCSSSASLCRRGLVCALSPVPRPLYVCFCRALEFPVFCGLPWMHQKNIRSALDGSVCGYARRKGSFCLGELTVLWTCVCVRERPSPVRLSDTELHCGENLPQTFCWQGVNVQGFTTDVSGCFRVVSVC